MNLSTIRVTRRFALRSLAAAAALAAGIVGPLKVTKTRAQQQIDPSFSNEILPTLGLPELNLEQTASGLLGLPESVLAGRYVVNYKATDVVGYLLFAQHPANLTMDQALEQAKQAGTFDQQQPGWVYGGGTYADPGAEVQVVVDLPAGDWKVVSSSQPPESENSAEDEIYSILPLAVTEAGGVSASPVASPMAVLPVDVPVDMPGMAFVMQSDIVAAGPGLWEFKNSGDQAHHMVMMRTPHLITETDMQALFEMFSSATPPAGDHWFLNSTWVAYTALVSPGLTVWNEFSLDPGTYVMLCFISDIETGMPHLMMGMWTPFTVE